VTVFVVVSRYIQASDTRYARRSVEQAGYFCRIAHSSIPGYVAAEFGIGLERDEPPVPEAFEIEVDDVLSGSWVPSLLGGARPVRFAGTGSRIEGG
jgi:hypothetical protein